MKKVPIHYSPNAEDIIVKFPKTQLKKGEVIKVPDQFDSIFTYKDGAQELIQNRREIILEYPVESIYFVLHTRNVLHTKWGTPSRILIADQKAQSQMLGAFGRIEYSLQNAAKLITTTMKSEEVLTQNDLNHLILSMIPDVFNTYFATIQSMDINEPAKVAIDLQAKLTPELSTRMDERGLELKGLSIENVNFELPERMAS